LKSKNWENEKAMHVHDIERLVAEIEVLKFVLYLVSRECKKKVIE
jgi:hypothetical protein